MRTEAQKARSRSYYAMHRETILATQKRYRETHRERDRHRLAAWRASNPDKVLAAQLRRPYDPEQTAARQRKKLYGLLPEEYDRLRTVQRNRCAICEQPKKLEVDHNHRTGRVRSLLCRTCNTFVGYLESHGDLLPVALDYIGLVAVFPEEDDTVEAA